MHSFSEDNIAQERCEEIMHKHTTKQWIQYDAVRFSRAGTQLRKIRFKDENGYVLYVMTTISSSVPKCDLPNKMYYLV